MPYLTTFIDEAGFIGEYDGYQMFCIPTRHSSVWIIRTRTSADEARWQKECVDKANYDKLGTDRRPTFMIQCAAGAKVDSSSKPASQK